MSIKTILPFCLQIIPGFANRPAGRPFSLFGQKRQGWKRAGKKEDAKTAKKHKACGELVLAIVLILV